MQPFSLTYERFYVMLTSNQIRAARALLRWSAQKLADQAGLGISTIQRMEATSGVPSASARNLDTVQRSLEAAGVVFIDENGGGPGVRLGSTT
jgi:transcriptional regulator with XRE-family HTH domain